LESEQAVREGLALLVTSLRQDVDAIQRKAYVRGLAKVPGDVIEAAVDRLIAQLAAQPMGKRYFPTVPDWLAACAAVVNERRSLAARQAKALAEDCPNCVNGWETVQVDGIDHVKRCLCFTRGLELVAAAGEPIALPPAPREYDGDAA
jgi:hypothetical protein